MKRTLLIILKVLTLILVTGCIVLFYYYITARDLTVSSYQIELDVNEPICIVHLTDLHSKEFGKNNCELIEMVNEQNPDLIFISGDMINNYDDNAEILINLISSLKDIAPVYFGYGNHEYTWERTHHVSLREEVGKAGAVAVDNDYVDIEFKGTELRIGGYMGYYRQPHMFNKSKEQIQAEKDFAEDFENTDRIKLLINHIPTGWLDWHYIDKYPVDLVFCGHYHGGMIRIPFTEQGLYAPYIGWFPKYTKGMFSGKEATCILSAGLGSEHSVPRINNPPEIVVVNLVPKN